MSLFQVYIKDTASTKLNTPVVQAVQEPVSSTTTNALNTTVLNNVNSMQEVMKTGQNEQIPMYTVQLPTVVQNDDKIGNKSDANQTKSSQVTYSINPLNLARNEPLTVNLNSELVNVAQLVDLDSIICQPSVPKTKPMRSQKQMKMSNDPSVIKIQFSEADFDANQLKLPHIKSALPNKFAYSIKIDESKNVSVNQVVLNQISDDSQMINQNLCNVYSNNSLNMNSHQLTTPNTSLCNNTNTLTQFIQNVDTNVRNYVAPPVKHVNYTTNNVVTNTNEPVFINNTVKPISSFTESASTLKIHTCDICKKTFKRREHLYQHVKLHTGFRPFTCQNCNKSFMRKEHLLRHMTSHSGLKNFMCDVCEKSFSRNDNLLKHKKTHGKQSSFTCEVCQKQFVMKHYFLAHKLTHESDKCNVSQMWGLLKA